METIVSIESVEDCRRFFADLCTPAELQSLADRWRVVQLIDKGVPYREIYQQTGVSTATVTRVARSLAQGHDGYRRILDGKAERR
ncbi:MAG: YerC/YecD family TrpR-related protein [Proteobacteria bacterium]|nr:YerC/YecD family TrpR-related protein [Pseudomonadota bacterium]